MLIYYFHKISQTSDRLTLTKCKIMTRILWEHIQLMYNDDTDALVGVVI